MSEKVSSKKDTPKKLTVMISSTARDLPAHREEVMHACLRQGMLPKMMEHLPASDAEAISASIKLVDEADIYVGVFAHRYGYVPTENNPQQISITEMEYNRAVKQKIPRLIFVMHKDHPLKFEDVEQGEGAVKLKAFKERIQTSNIVNFFDSPVDLRSHVINSLSHHREPDLTAFHYISDIPEPPEAFIAHPYTLLQTHRLVGRQKELNLLTDWVTRRQDQIYRARMLNIVAIGGMGKSALTWKWFQDIAPQEMKPLAGRMWWSFYESDARFENFITRALAYVTRRPLGEVQEIPSPERETQLLAALDREPFLIVMDGLERILIAYARMDAAYLADDDFDRQTANVVANAYGLPASAAESFVGQHILRKTADPRVGGFLRKLATVRAARILVSTRLYPADLQTVTGEPSPGCFAAFLPGLSDDDALDLWRAIGVSGARESLLPLFNRVENHPLLIQSLASEVARYRPAPGDFDKWKLGHPDFNPFSLPLANVRTHVLEFALRGLNDGARRALQIIAAFRMPANYDTLTALLMGEGKPCAGERELDEVLTELEDRGLVGWDRRANRYDLHPIVRGVVWSGVGDDTRRDVYTSLHAHFEAVPEIDDWREVSSLEDLTPAIELYNTLIGLGRYDDAFAVFQDRLSRAMAYRLSASRQLVELAERFFPDGLDALPRLRGTFAQGYAISALGTGLIQRGCPGASIATFRQMKSIFKDTNDLYNVMIALSNLAEALLLSGSVRLSETSSRSGLLLTRNRHDQSEEAWSLYWVGLALTIRGAKDHGKALLRALNIRLKLYDRPGEGLARAYLAQRALWMGDPTAAQPLAQRAWELAAIRSDESDFIRAARLQGTAALFTGDPKDVPFADERLHHALTRARMVNLVQEELPALVALAELRRRQSDLKAARELLDDLWEAAERGPYPLIHSDACNVLAQIERDAGNLTAATDAATKAFRLAWCDGPPFAYHRGLTAARKHL
ncbi:MAG: DUF4062 domain-containing protein, partial [Blastocatellia bacterium]|nr:DUF4062 domain-containing protein [Blastocatellia bacterium]